jgi:hypothetical protein
MKKIIIIVAHPDDETLWAGGTLLTNPQWQWTILSMCRADDEDRSQRFYKTVDYFRAAGIISDLNDGPEQTPLLCTLVQRKIMANIPDTHYDLVITHCPRGEYTYHRRHSEVSRAVRLLWENDKIQSNEFWMFAYEDGNKKYLPRDEKKAHKKIKLSEQIWNQKYKIITDIYGFNEDSFEAKTTPKTEAFWCFNSPQQYHEWFINRRISINESHCVV